MKTSRLRASATNQKKTEASGNGESEQPGDDTDDGDSGNENEFVPSVTMTIKFENVSTRDETPNQGWVNKYSPSGNAYTVNQIHEIKRLV